MVIPETKRSDSKKSQRWRENASRSRPAILIWLNKETVSRVCKRRRCSLTKTFNKNYPNCIGGFSFLPYPTACPPALRLFGARFISLLVYFKTAAAHTYGNLQNTFILPHPFFLLGCAQCDHQCDHQCGQKNVRSDGPPAPRAGFCFAQTRFRPRFHSYKADDDPLFPKTVKNPLNGRVISARFCFACF